MPRWVATRRDAFMRPAPDDAASNACLVLGKCGGQDAEREGDRPCEADAENQGIGDGGRDDFGEGARRKVREQGGLRILD